MMELGQVKIDIDKAIKRKLNVFATEIFKMVSNLSTNITSAISNQNCSFMNIKSSLISKYKNNIYKNNEVTTKNKELLDEIINKDREITKIKENTKNMFKIRIEESYNSIKRKLMDIISSKSEFLNTLEFKMSQLSLLKKNQEKNNEHMKLTIKSCEDQIQFLQRQNQEKDIYIKSAIKSFYTSFDGNISIINRYFNDYFEKHNTEYNSLKDSLNNLQASLTYTNLKNMKYRKTIKNLIEKIDYRKIKNEFVEFNNSFFNNTIAIRNYIKMIMVKFKEYTKNTYENHEKKYIEENKHIDMINNQILKLVESGKKQSCIKDSLKIDNNLNHTEESFGGILLIDDLLDEDYKETTNKLKVELEDEKQVAIKLAKELEKISKENNELKQKLRDLDNPYAISKRPNYMKEESKNSLKASQREFMFSNYDYSGPNTAHGSMTARGDLYTLDINDTINTHVKKLIIQCSGSIPLG